MSFQGTKHADLGETVTLDCGLRWPKSQIENQILKKLDYAAVYAVGWDRKGPVKVGWSIDPPQRLAALQVSCPYRLELFELTWTLGRPFAVRLEAEIQKILDVAQRRMQGDWFDIPVELVLGAFQVASDRLAIRTRTHDAVLEEIAGVRDRIAEKQTDLAGS